MTCEERGPAPAAWRTRLPGTLLHNPAATPPTGAPALSPGPAAVPAACPGPGRSARPTQRVGIRGCWSEHPPAPEDEPRPRPAPNPHEHHPPPPPASPSVPRHRRRPRPEPRAVSPPVPVRPPSGRAGGCRDTLKVAAAARGLLTAAARATGRRGRRALVVGHWLPVLPTRRLAAAPGGWLVAVEGKRHSPRVGCYILDADWLRRWRGDVREAEQLVIAQGGGWGWAESSGAMSGWAEPGPALPRVTPCFLPNPRESSGGRGRLEAGSSAARPWRLHLGSAGTRVWNRRRCQVQDERGALGEKGSVLPCAVTLSTPRRE